MSTIKLHGYAAGLGLVLLLALALRTIGLTWGYPYGFHIDEEHTVGLASRLMRDLLARDSLDPYATVYGVVPLYLMAITTAVAEHVLAWIKAVVPVPINSVPMLYMGRLLSALAGTATVWLTAELARRLFGRGVALLSALLLAVCLLPVREAHFATVDTLLVALMALTLLVGERLASRGAWRDYLAVGVALALAVSTKVTAGLLVVPLLVAWGARYRRERGRFRQTASIEPQTNALASPWATHVPRLVIAGLVSAALWLTLNPYVLLNPAVYFDLDNNDSLYTQWLVVHGKLPVLYTLQFTGTLPYLYVVTNWLRWGMGLPLEILALAGVGYSLWRLWQAREPLLLRRGQGLESTASTLFADAYLLAWFLAYFLTVGAWHAAFIRYALPLMPVLCLLAGRLLVDIWRQSRQMACVRGVVRRAGVVGTTLACTVGIIGASLAYTTGFLQLYRQPDVRLTAVDWLKTHAPAGASIFVEKDEGLFLHRDAHRKMLRMTDYTWRVWNPYEIDGVRSIRYQAPSVSDAQTRAHLDRLLTTDYVVISNHWSQRFTAAATRFPSQAGFYRRLFEGDAGYRLFHTFQVYPKLGRLTWRDDAAEMTFRFFDHPAIYVFVRASSVANQPTTGGQAVSSFQPSRQPSLATGQ